MDFNLDDDQAMVKSLAERFVADRYASGARAGYRREPAGYSGRNWALLAETGMLSVPLPEAAGGLGGGLIEVAVLMEALGRGLVAEPVLAEAVIAAGLIAEAGTEAQQARWLEPFLTGAAHPALAWAEHGTRYDRDRPATVCEGGRISGAKTAVEGGADTYIVTAREGDTVGLWLVTGDAPGIARRDYRLVDGSIAAELRLDAVPAEPMPGGLAALDRVADVARVAATAEMIGLAETIFATTLDYVRQRHQFKTPIGSFQAIQHRLADQYTALEQSRSQLYRAFSGDPAAIAGAKAFVSAAAVRLGEECIQFHGGMGVSDELDIGHAHKRVLRLATLFGDVTHEQRRYHRLLSR